MSQCTALQVPTRATANPINEVPSSNNAMNDGQNSPADIERHTEGWIKAHQTLFDSWINQARAAAR